MSNAMLTTKIATFEPEGFVSAANANEFSKQLAEAVETTKNSILLVDMKKVEFLDSAGLMALIDGFHLAESLGRRIGLCSLAPSVRMIFELTQLNNVFEIFESRESFEAGLS